MTDSTSTTTAGYGTSGLQDTAREEAASVAGDAKAAGERVAGSAKDGAQRVAKETGTQAKRLAGQVSSELTEQAGEQQQRVAGGLRSVGEELHGMASGSEQQGLASDVAHQIADRADSVAEWLEQRDPGTLLKDVTQFARRRPGLFIAIAAGTGILAGRLVKSLATTAAEEAESASTTADTSVTAPAGTMPTPPTSPVAPTAPFGEGAAGPDAYTTAPGATAPEGGTTTEPWNAPGTASSPAADIASGSHP